MAIAALIPIITAIVGAAASAYNTNQVAKKQDRAIAAGIREKSRLQRQADSRIADELARVQASTSKPEQMSTMAQYQEAIRGTQQQAQAGQALAGLSKEYDAATTAAQGQTGQYLSQVIDSLSRIDAAGLQRQREGVGYAGLGRDLSLLSREGEGVDYLANLRAQGVRRSPYLDALAAGLSAYGGGYGGDGKFSKGGTTTGKTKTGGNTKGGI